jgi:hypothetical protein
MQVVCRFCNEKLDKKEAVYVERYTKKGDLIVSFFSYHHTNPY